MELMDTYPYPNSVNYRRAAKNIAKGFGRVVRNVAAHRLASSGIDWAAKKFFGTSKKGKTVYARRAGFVGKHRYPGRVNRRRYRKAFNGVQFNLETVSTLNDEKCVFVGHHSTPVMTMLKYVAYGLLKRMMNKANIQFSSFRQSVVFNATDTIAITYRRFTTDVVQSISTNIVIATTYADAADLIYNQLLFPLVDVTSPAFGSGSRLLAMTWSRTDGPTMRIELTDAKISYLQKSSLKLQNRSVTVTADNEAEDVNNVPVVGKSYEFKGNMMIPKDNTISTAPPGTGPNAAFQVPDELTGTVAMTAGIRESMQEPPDPYFFVGKIKTNKIRLDPGEVKTSVLTDKKTISLNGFMRFIAGILKYTDNPLYSPYVPYGVSRLFAIERMIGKQVDEPNASVRITYEHDIKLWLEILESSGKFTVAMNTVA